jgi:hypothetical protein
MFETRLRLSLEAKSARADSGMEHAAAWCKRCQVGTGRICRERAIAGSTHNFNRVNS